MYFPTVIATDAAFCNREQELKHLAYNLNNGIPTLIVSPRRYGKTSLALRSLAQMNFPYVHIDLFKYLTEAEIIQAILNGIASLLAKLESKPKQLMHLAQEFFSEIHIKIVLHQLGLGIELSPTSQDNPITTLSMTLEKLEQFLSKRKMKAVLFLDEFQVLAEIAKNHACEAALREIAQKAKNILFIFSGSNRHMVELMFHDKNRPFFNLCDKLVLDRISGSAYEPYIQKAATERWGQSIDGQCLATILFITEHHPYYVNKLCSLIWMSDQLPHHELIQETWQRYVWENKSAVEQELSLLSVNQRRMMIYLAKDREISQPYQLKYAKLWNVSAASIYRALEILQQKDYVKGSHDKRYCVLDPLVASVLRLKY